MKDTHRKRSLRNKIDINAAQEVQVRGTVNLEVASPPKKRVRAERFTVHGNIFTRIAKISSDRSQLRQRSKTSEEKVAAMADGIMKKKEKDKKTPGGTNTTEPRSKIQANNTLRL